MHRVLRLRLMLRPKLNISKSPKCLTIVNLTMHATCGPADARPRVTEVMDPSVPTLATGGYGHVKSLFCGFRGDHELC